MNRCTPGRAARVAMQRRRAKLRRGRYRFGWLRLRRWALAIGSCCSVLLVKYAAAK